MYLRHFGIERNQALTETSHKLYPLLKSAQQTLQSSQVERFFFFSNQRKMCKPQAKPENLQQL